MALAGTGRIPWSRRFAYATVALAMLVVVEANTAPLLVANRSSHEVTIVDVERGEVVGRIETGEGPHLLSNVIDGRVLTTGYGEYPRPHAEPIERRPPFIETLNSRVRLVDIEAQAIVWDVVLEDCRKPHASWIIGNRGYVTCEPEEVVQVIDIDSGAPLTRIATQQSGAHVLSYEPMSRILGVSNVASGSLTLVDVDNETARSLRLAPGSEGAVAFQRNLWVANTGNSSVSIVDPKKAAETGRIDSVCGFPIAFSYNDTDSLWLACFASAELVEIDPQKLSVRRRISLPANPLNILLHPDDDIAYVSYPRRNAVGEIDLASGKELRQITVGIEPDGLRWAN